MSANPESPQTSPETSPQTSPETSPQISPQALPEISPETSPQISPQALPETLWSRKQQQVFYVQLPQNSRQSVKVTFDKNKYPKEDISRILNNIFSEIVDDSILAVKTLKDSMKDMKMIYIDKKIKDKKDSVSYTITFFKLPNEVGAILDKHCKEGMFRYIKFYISKQWMSEGEQIMLSVLNGEPNISDMAITNLKGKSAPYLSKVYDLQNPEW